MNTQVKSAGRVLDVSWSFIASQDRPMFAARRHSGCAGDPEELGAHAAVDVVSDRGYLTASTQFDISA